MNYEKNNNYFEEEEDYEISNNPYEAWDIDEPEPGEYDFTEDIND